MAMLQESTDVNGAKAAQRPSVWSSSAQAPLPVHRFQAGLARNAGCLDEMPDDYARWPGAVRLALLGTGIAASWWLAIQIGRLLF